ncbi:MAG: HDOD domain-containing protein [Methylibium sp.]|uniref:serine/threonine protein kinase n=1 Tax=Methylibium sp. TaxID=2067992 RepID=UPI00185A6C0D|nr:HDOD domain-containing protein [Methylibium sp.]MBA3595970.1 HDOD domain-containing protein [Methylibium sp.]
MPSSPPNPPDAVPAGRPLPAGMPGRRRIGRYALVRLLAKSSRGMLWLAQAADGREAYVSLPRQQPADAASLRAWLQGARDAARLSHPQLVTVAEIGLEERWPFVASPRAAGITLAEHLVAGPQPTPAQSAQWLCDVLHGLAFAHEAGLSHGDIGVASVLIDAQGRALLMSAGADANATESALADATAPAPPVGSTGALRSQRAAHERDLLACGLLLHRLLAGRPALDEADAATAVQRLEREIVRLGWSTPQPVSDALRAICNRATASEPRSRYLGARSLERALQGWIDAQAGSEGVLSLLLDRLSSVGHLPALPGLLSRVSEIAAMEQQRIAEMTELIVQDPALAFELLRQVNTAHLAASSGQGFGTVTTVRRAVQLLGIQGLRRAAAGLRAWPGPLGAAPARALSVSLREARMAAHVARELCPADMDGEAVFLIALLQHLGGLLLRYHFPDEAEQIARLVDPGEGARGMPAAAAACAVIGVDLDTLAVAVARHWGLDEHVLASLRRASLETPVRVPDDRRDMVRLLGSAAAEAVAAAAAPPAQAATALARVTQRYVRALVLAPGELSDALHKARRAVGAESQAAERSF